ncbi:MAG: phosphotransferase [Phycisphaerales bacterium]|nr:phosphotransferase [Phycisphaerales bacterium]
MSQPWGWGADGELTAEAAREVIVRDAPALASGELRLLGEGWDCRVFIGDGELVYKFGKRRQMARYLEAECRLLEMLAGRLPVEIPVIRARGEGWICYKLLSGTAISTGAPSSEITRQVGRFLAALHTVPASEAGVCGIEITPRGTGRMRERAQAGAAHASGALAADQAEWVARFIATEPPPSGGTMPVVVHNDLNAEHILVHDGAVSGIIDWTDAALGDPAADFAGLAHWGGMKLVHEVLREYPLAIDPGFAARAAYIAACIGIIDAGYGVQTGRAHCVERGRQVIATAMRDSASPM